STYDLRFLLKATARLRDGETVELPGPKFVGDRVIQRLDHTQIGQLLTDFGLVPELADTVQRARGGDAPARSPGDPAPGRFVAVPQAPLFPPPRCGPGAAY